MSTFLHTKYFNSN